MLPREIIIDLVGVVPSQHRSPTLRSRVGPGSAHRGIAGRKKPRQRLAGPAHCEDRLRQTIQIAQPVEAETNFIRLVGPE